MATETKGSGLGIFESLLGGLGGTLGGGFLEMAGHGLSSVLGLGDSTSSSVDTGMDTMTDILGMTKPFMEDTMYSQTGRIGKDASRMAQLKTDAFRPSARTMFDYTKGEGRADQMIAGTGDMQRQNLAMMGKGMGTQGNAMKNMLALTGAPAAAIGAVGGQVYDSLGNMSAQQGQQGMQGLHQAYAGAMAGSAQNQQVFEGRRQGEFQTGVVPHLVKPAEMTPFAAGGQMGTSFGQMASTNAKDLYNPLAATGGAFAESGSKIMGMGINEWILGQIFGDRDKSNNNKGNPATDDPWASQNQKSYPVMYG
jgi:hypothetical protein